MFFSIREQTVYDPDTDVTLEFIPEDTVSRDNADYTNTAVVGLRMTVAGKSTHLRFDRNGGLISAMAEQVTAGVAEQAIIPILAPQGPVILVPGQHDTIDVPASTGMSTLGPRKDLKFTPVKPSPELEVATSLPPPPTGGLTTTPPSKSETAPLKKG
jgi:hypothetical protein